MKREAPGLDPVAGFCNASFHRKIQWRKYIKNILKNIIRKKSQCKEQYKRSKDQNKKQ